MSSAIKGPGMLWVTSRISKESESLLDERTFLKWYDEDHIAEIVATEGINDAFRCININKGSPCASKPFLVFYPIPDLEFTQGQAFKNIKVKSDILPGTGIIYDMADFDVSYLGLVSKTKARGKREAAQYLLVSAVEPAAGMSDEDTNEFFDLQLATISKEPGYLRTLRFKLLYARTNAQSRALKGLPTTNEPAPEPPTWQAVHEFDEEPTVETKQKVNDESSNFLQTAQQTELHVYKLAKYFGSGKLFDRGAYDWQNVVSYSSISLDQFFGFASLAPHLSLAEQLDSWDNSGEIFELWDK